MAIGRISGPMLFNNLERQGVDLAFQSNLLYLDVNNLRVGVLNSAPQYVLDSSGNVKLANIIIENNRISSNTGVVDLGTTSNIKISGGAANYVLFTDGNGNLSWGEISSLDANFGNIFLSNNTVSIVQLNGNLNLEANGIGSVVTPNDFYAGNVYAFNISGNVSSNTGSFLGNVSAPWFEGNLNGTIINVTNENVTNGNAVTYYITNLNSTNGNVTTLYATNFNTGNAVISGGYIIALSNATITTGNVESWYAGIINASSANIAGPLYASSLNTANAVISGGYISSLTNAYITTSAITNFSTANAVISGGYFTGISNITATTGNVESWYATTLNSSAANIDGALYTLSLNTANAVITGGLISNVDIQANNFSTANILVTGGILYNIDTQANNFSTANALITGGVLYNIDVQANNFNTANALIGGGVLYNIDIQANNFNTANAVISGGYINSLSNLTAITTQTDNFSSPNVLISGGLINNVDVQANNFSTGNALINGGVLYNIDVQANNFSTANALITGGNVTANLEGNLTATFGDFAGNVYADWFIGNIEARKANFSDLVFVNSNLTISGYLTSTGNLVAAGNIISQKITSPTGDLHISAATNDPNNIIRFDSVSAFDIPSGTNAQRPPNPDYGYVRFNTDAQTIEWWAGTDWFRPINPINTQTITPDGINNVYTLDYASTESGILVNINGTLQQPGTAYTVTGTQITFAGVPLIDDIIEIRFLTAGVVAAPYFGGTITGNVLISNTEVSTSSTTGALVVNGGTGIAGNINIGGNVGLVSTTGTPTNTLTPTSWLKIYVSGSAYYLPLYQ